jgi:DNA-binding winged helix-turn-helix (wHTH) protein
VAESATTSAVVRFGVFEVDLRAGELRKNGSKRKLAGQPFRVLAILLERPGEVVTREELQKRLCVDVDHNLNTAINKIREVLGDAAENPRFVTLRRRGYRFVAPVDVGAGLVPAPQGDSQRVRRFSETDAVRLQHLQVGRIAKHSCGFSELVPRREVHLL